MKNIIDSLNQIVDILSSRRIDCANMQEIYSIVCDINKSILSVPQLNFQKDYDFTNDEDYYRFIEDIKVLCNLYQMMADDFDNCSNMIDKQFYELYYKIKYIGKEQLYSSVVEYFCRLPEQIKVEFTRLKQRYIFLHNEINYHTNDFSLIEEYVGVLCENVENLKWLYDNLSDYRSKKILNGIINFYFDFDVEKLNLMTENIFCDYFDLDIVDMAKNEVIVDAGAYIGDTIADYLHCMGNYKRIYAYEMAESTCGVLKNNTHNLPNVEIRNKGIAECNKTVYIHEEANSAGNSISIEGDKAVELVSLDNDISEKIDIIKMDIEGALEHIKNEKPKLLISAYHCLDDIFILSRMIYDIRSDYKFYIRYNGHGSIWPCDYVLIAV